MDTTKPRLLVTGGSGYLGGWVTRLARDNWDVTATYRSHPANESVDWRQLDVRDESEVTSLVAGLRPQAIVHTAALNPGQGNDFEAVNVAGTRHIARAAAEMGARLIHISTDMVFDGQRGDYAENDPAAPLTPYGHTKALAEKAVVEAGAEAVIVRTSLIYGWRPTVARAIQWMVDSLNDGKPVILWSDEMRCPIWVESLAAAIIELATHRYTGALHVAGDQVISRYDFGVEMLRSVGIDSSTVVPTPSPTDNLRPLKCTLDSSLARTLLSTPLPGVDEILARGIGALR